ncbi:MAG: DUF4395 domain-containing protein [Anaerolineales bacterium]|nr:DUF4395 domain-containing protein [Anaerolineales bacterium]
MNETSKKIDHSALISSQVVIVLLNVLAFILDQPWLAAVVTTAMLVGTILSVPGFGFVYRFLLRPIGLVKPYILLDNPEPHRFSQGFGGVVMLAGTILLFSGASVAGWSLIWLVAALAALNAFGGFCVGCFVYYWLNRLGVPVFSKHPPEGTFPGARPKRTATHES